MALERKLGTMILQNRNNHLSLSLSLILESQKPQALRAIFVFRHDIGQRDTRAQLDDLVLSQSRTELFRHSFRCVSVDVWNSIPMDIVAKNPSFSKVNCSTICSLRMLSLIFYLCCLYLLNLAVIILLSTFFLLLIFCLVCLLVFFLYIFFFYFSRILFLFSFYVIISVIVWLIFFFLFYIHIRFARRV